MPTALVWLGVFAGLALLVTVPVHFHLAALRRTEVGSRGRAEAGEPRSRRPCPQCGHPSFADAAFCDNCGVPMMLFELKLAREAVGPVPPAGAGQVLPIIYQDLCIGCSACVNACDQSVLQIVAGKSTVVDVAACTGAAVCAEVCPTGACQLTGQGASRRVEVPRIGPNFETNQKGIYAVGELGGLGLIKNAVTEGALVIKRIREQHVKRAGVQDLIIIGAGPAGLSASLAATEAGLSFTLFEQGAFADTIRRFPNKKIVMAEPVQVPTYGSLWISDAPKETLLGVWQMILESTGIQVNENEQVLGVKRQADGTLQVETRRGTYRSQKVILAIGKRGSPRRLEANGRELPKVLYTLADAAEYTQAKLLVVGGGDSAAEAAIGLANQSGNEVTLSYRQKDFNRIKEKTRNALTGLIRGGRVRFLPRSQVVDVREKEVVLQVEGSGRLRLDNDLVFALLGGSSPRVFLESMGVPMVTKEVCVSS